MENNKYELKQIQKAAEKVIAELYYCQLTYDTVTGLVRPKGWGKFHKKTNKYLLGLHKMISQKIKQ